MEKKKFRVYIDPEYLDITKTEVEIFLKNAGCDSSYGSCCSNSTGDNYLTVSSEQRKISKEIISEYPWIRKVEEVKPDKKGKKLRTKITEILNYDIF